MYFSHFNFFLLRAPAIPIQKFLEMNNCCSEEQLVINIEALLIEYPEIIYAMSISSKQMGAIISSWLKGKIKLEKKHLYTIYKYIARMATRSTPFGLSAGVGFGIISDQETSFKILTRPKIHSRVSASFLSSQFNGTALAPVFKDRELLLNSTLFTVNGYYRYARKLERNSTDHSRIKIKVNPLLELVYQNVKNGTTFLKLSKDLTQKGISEGEAVKYIINLLECEFLISIFNPSFSGDKYRELIMDLPLKGALEKLAGNINNRVDNDYSEMFEFWENLSLKTQIDLIPELEVNKEIRVENLNINKLVVQMINSELTELLPYLGGSHSPELEIFKTKFLEKYDLQEIPLLEVMDSDLSIGYGDKTQQYRSKSPLLKSLEINKISPVPKIDLYKLFDKGSIGNSRTVELELPVDSEQYFNKDHLPPTSALHGILYSENSSIPEQDSFSFLLKSWNGPTSNHLLTRFAYMNDELLKKLVETSRFDQKMFEGYILAEIVYSPTGKEANILQRPELYSYEIPVLGNSLKSKDYQIPLQDINISIRDNKVLLRSIKHNKYIIPRLSTAHNYRRANPIYRFLADLQYQFSDHYFHWNWNVSAERVFYPRITYKHLILSRACWYIDKCCLERNDMDNLALFIKKQKIDDRVVIVEGDNELYIDLRTPWGKDILLRKLIKSTVLLYEIIENENFILNDIKNQKYVHEITIPLAINSPKSTPMLPDKNRLTIERSFPPGSKWTYLKIYCSPTDADQILLNIIYPVILQMQNQNFLENWFFVRYNDPDFHIRLRFKHSENSFQNFKTIVELFSNKIYTGDSGINRIQYDTYEREVERYGYDTIEYIEQIFSIDSNFILKSLNYDKLADENLRWKIALIAINSIFNFMNVQIEDRILYLSNWSHALSSEFSLSKNQTHQINMDYRKIKNIIYSLLKNQDNDMLFIRDIINQMELELETLLKKLTEDQTSNIIKKLGSILHMFLNRLFSTDQKLNEMVIYIYLYHYYRSVKALKRY